jgi:prepilin-type N-terminal cleavage/methylation domain-containing protein
MRRRGFSLLEVMMVVAVGLIVTVTAVPNMMTGIANARMRASMTSFASLLQNCRMQAVKENHTLSARTVAGPEGLMAYVKRASDSNPLVRTDPQVQLQAPVIKLTAPSGPGAPPTVDAAVLGFTPQTGDPSYNPRGLPCVYSGGNCVNAGFIYYFKDTRSESRNGWAAVSISPAGRIKKWFWSGSAWTD